MKAEPPSETKPEPPLLSKLIRRLGSGITGPIIAGVLIVLMIVMALATDDPPAVTTEKPVEAVLAELDGDAGLTSPIGRALDRADAIFKEDRTEIAIMTANVKEVIKEETGRRQACLDILTGVCASVPENTMADSCSYSDIAADWVTMQKPENR